MSNYTSDPTRVVGCRICALDGVDKRVEAKKLMGHIGGAHSKQGWNKAKYFDRWGSDGEKDFAFYMPSKDAIAKTTIVINEVNTQKGIPQALPTDVSELLADPNLSLLDSDERVFYEQFYNLVLQAVDRDEVQMPVIGSLAIDMVVMKRLRRSQLEATAKGAKLGPLKNLEDAIKNAEGRIQKSMQTLCISREMLMKTREQIRSTAAGLISGYMDEIERNTPEALEALMIDEKRVLARMYPRLESMVFKHAKELEPEQKEDNNGVTGAIISLEDALQRAGVTL
jgi:hypothetical protein